MKYIGIIPARYSSSRFPGKPLVMLGNMTMIQRVYEQSKIAFDNVIVATDDERIKNVVENFGGIAVMTSATHRSGTDRCAEAIDIYQNTSGQQFDVIVNIQGDEPFVQPEQFQKLNDCFLSPEIQIATLARPITDYKDIFNPNKPKVILNFQNQAIYFSRSPIPHVRDENKENWLKHSFYLHVGLYAYRYNVLKAITRLSPSPLELAESLEQLRWLENGYKIKVAITAHESYAIDTPEDLEKAKLFGFF